jgi:hypothetical protein
LGEAPFPVLASLLLLILLFPTGLELAGSWLGLAREGTPWRHLDRNPSLQVALAIEESATDAFGAGEFLRQQLASDGPFRYAGYSGFGYPPDETPQNYMERRLDPFVQAILTNGRPIFLGLYDVQGYNPLQLSRYVEFMNALNGGMQDYHTAFLFSSAARSPLLDLLDVRYLLIDASLPRYRADVAALTAGAHEVYRSPWVIVFERPSKPPHAWIVHDVRDTARGEALLLLASRTVDPYQTALVEGTPPTTSQPTGPGQDSAHVTVYEPDHLTIATRSSADGFLVVSEIYANGWRAFVDGQETPILPTDHALRGIALPAGAHTVEMRYEPLSLRAGLAISGIATVAMLAAFISAAWSVLARRSITTSAVHLKTARDASPE